MKRHIAYLCLLFCVTNICAQESYYNETKTFVEDGYTYQCDVEKPGVMVYLYNKDYKDVYTKQETVIQNAYEDSILALPDPEGRFLLTDVPMQVEWKESAINERELIRSLFSEEEKLRLKGDGLGVILHINPNTGKIDGVIFNFLTTQAYATIPVSTYRKIELKLKDLVIDDYARKNSVPANALTQSEIRDIILGVQIAPPSEERQQLAAEEDATSGLMTAVTTRTTTKTGENVVVQTLSNYEQTQYQSKSDWRKRAIQTANLALRTSRFSVPLDGVMENDETLKTLILPLNTLKKFVEISDPYVQVAALLYGQYAPDNESIIEIRCFIIPPQTGNYDSVDFSKTLPSHPLLEGLSPVGWLHTCAIDENLMSPAEAITAASILDKNKEVVNDSLNFTSIVISYPPGSCTIRAFRLTEDGLKWGTQNRETKDRAIGFEDVFFDKVPVVLTETYNGFFMIPQGIEWNLNFQSLKLLEHETYDVDLGTPLPFFDQRHRPNHFLK